MADEYRVIEERNTTRPGNNGGIIFIVGGLVVAVGVLVWLVVGGDLKLGSGASDTNTNTSVTIEAPAAEPAPAAPAPEPTAPEPAAPPVVDPAPKP